VKIILNISKRPVNYRENQAALFFLTSDDMNVPTRLLFEHFKIENIYEIIDHSEKFLKRMKCYDEFNEYYFGKKPE